MANSRIMLTCKHCGVQMVLAKGDFGHYYTYDDVGLALTDFFKKHEYGECLGENADEDCFSNDAKDHFVILEKGDKLGKELFIMNEYNYENKKDKGKLRMDLIPPEALEGIAEVLTFGAEKYGANSWRQVEPERYVAALLRHYAAYMRDHHSVDDESGILHIKHLLCNAVFLMCMEVADEERKKANSEAM